MPVLHSIYETNFLEFEILAFAPRNFFESLLKSSSDVESSRAIALYKIDSNLDTGGLEYSIVPLIKVCGVTSSCIFFLPISLKNKFLLSERVRPFPLIII